VTGFQLLLGVLEVVLGVAMVTRREQFARRVPSSSVASRRGLLLILGLMLTFVGVIQIAEALV
jgi:uncharacterized membrane protein